MEDQETQTTPIALGDIVELRKPYRPSELEGTVPRVITGPGTLREQYEAYRAWPGFTHGIVVEILSRQGPFPDSLARSVSLHLYDPERSVIFMGLNKIPEYVDFNVAELRLYKRATEMGYSPEPQQDEGQRTETEAAPAVPEFHAEVFRSEHACWKCGGMLVEIKPDYHGYKLVCPTCRMATSPAQDLQASLGEVGGASGYLGTVAGISFPYDLHLDGGVAF